MKHHLLQVWEIPSSIQWYDASLRRNSRLVDSESG